MKSNDDEDELVKKEHGSDEDDEDETLVRHVDEKKDNIIIQKDLKEGEDEYNGFTFWRLENQNSFVNSEFK